MRTELNVSAPYSVPLSHTRGTLQKVVGGREEGWEWLRTGSLACAS